MLGRAAALTRRRAGGPASDTDRGRRPVYGFGHLSVSFGPLPVWDTSPSPIESSTASPVQKSRGL